MLYLFIGTTVVVLDSILIVTPKISEVTLSWQDWILFLSTWHPCYGLRDPDFLAGAYFSEELLPLSEFLEDASLAHSHDEKKSV